VKYNRISNARPNHHQVKHYLLFLLVFFAAVCTGQNPPLLLKDPGNTFSANTLGPDVVSCSLKDRDGNLWFGTSENGIYRYDGNTFTHFSEKDGITDKHIFSVYQEKKGKIWIGTFSGLFQYDGKQFMKILIPHSYKMPALDAMGNIAYNPDCILAIHEDQDGNLWLGSMGFGVYRYSDGRFTFFPETEKSRSIIQCVSEGKDGTIWLGTRGNGIWTYKENSFQNFMSKTVRNNHILDILEDRNSNLWLSTVGGGVCLYKSISFSQFDYDGDHFSLISQSKSPCFLNVFAMLEDTAGNIWFCGDGGGVCSYDGRSFQNFTTKDGLISNQVTTVVEDDEGNIWFGSRGGGLCRYDGKSFTIFSLYD